MKNECSVNGWTISNIIQDRKAWVYNVATQKCAFTFMPVRIVTPQWMIGGVSIGRQFVKGTECDCWDKEDHIYCQDVATKSTKRVYTPVDQLGASNTEDYATFIEGAFDRKIFDLPVYCQNITTEYKVEEVDPVGCFLSE